MPPLCAQTVAIDDDPPSGIRTRPRTKLPWPRFDGSTPIGIDLAKSHQDVTRIVWKFFHVPGHPMEDLVQDVLLAIHRRNFTPSAFDPRKAKFATYTFMIAENVCRNLVASRGGGRRGKDRIPENLIDDISDHAEGRASSTDDSERIIDIIGTTDLDVCKALVGRRRCGEDATLAWLDWSRPGRWAICSVCRTHESLAEGKKTMSPVELSQHLAGMLA